MHKSMGDLVFSKMACLPCAHQWGQKVLKIEKKGFVKYLHFNYTYCVIRYRIDNVFLRTIPFISTNKSIFTVIYIIYVII